MYGSNSSINFLINLQEINNLPQHWLLFIENGGNFEVITSKLIGLKWDLDKRIKIDQ